MKRKRSQVSHLTTSTTVLSDDYSRIECELKISRIQESWKASTRCEDETAAWFFHEDIRKYSQFNFAYNRISRIYSLTISTR